MKASEILKQYANGRRDFRHLSLIGQSFKGKNLSGADFSGCDIRGTNFQKAILKNTIFYRAKAGLPQTWSIILFLSCFLISTCSGFFTLFSTAFIIVGWNRYELVSDIIRIMPIFSLCLPLIMNKIGKLTLIILFLIIITLLFISGILNISIIIPLFNVYLAGGIAFFIVIFGIYFIAFVIVIATAIAGFIGMIYIGGFILIFNAILACIASVTLIQEIGGHESAIIVAIIISQILAWVGIYLGWISLNKSLGKIQFSNMWMMVIKKSALSFSVTGGTSFYQANLTNADFTETILKNVDFREANLTQTCWQNAHKLDLADPHETILADADVRELMVTGCGYKKSYLGVKLRGANLDGANLEYADFKLADLSKASLRGANLEYANLTEVNAIETDFTKASMTGVCIEAWNIDSHTKLDEVDCEFVYLLENPKPNTDDWEIRPSSGIFQPGEFTKLFQEVLNTVDLIFQDGIDWKAFVTAFKELQIQNEDVSLKIQSIENKGDGVVVVKVAVPPDTNKEIIHSNFIQEYNAALKALEAEYKAKLDAKDSEINSYYRENVRMEAIIKLLATRDVNITNIQGDKNMSDNRNINARNYTERDSYRNTTMNDQASYVEGDYYNNPETRKNLAEAAGEIQELLDKLSETYPTNTTTGKIKIAGEAIEEIENNPQLKQKLLSAIKAGSLAAMDSMLNHPAASFLIAAMEDLQNNK